jgi:hypothetical protein
MITPTFPNIRGHLAIVESLREVVNQMSVVDDIEDNLQAAKALIEIAKLAQKAEEHFEYIRHAALVGAERRLPEALSRMTAKRLAAVSEADRIEAQEFLKSAWR